MSFSGQAVVICCPQPGFLLPGVASWDMPFSARQRASFSPYNPDGLGLVHMVI